MTEMRDEPGHDEGEHVAAGSGAAVLRPGGPGGEPDRDGVQVRVVEHDQRQEVVVPGGDEREEDDGHQAGGEQPQRDRAEDPQLSGAVHAGGLDEAVGDGVLGVDPHEVEAERADEGRQDDRPRGVHQARLGEEQIGGDRQRGGRDHDGAEDQVEGGTVTAEAVLGEAVAGRRREQCGAERARPGVEDGVEQPASEHAVVLGEGGPDVRQELRRVREPQAEGVEQVLGALGRGDQQPEEGQQEVRQDGQHRDGERGAATAGRRPARRSALNLNLPRRRGG